MRTVVRAPLILFGVLLTLTFVAGCGEDLEARLAQAKERNSDLYDELDLTTDEIISLDSALETRQAQVADLEAEVDGLRARVLDLRIDVSEIDPVRPTTTPAPTTEPPSTVAPVTSPPAPDPTPIAQSVCRHFRNIVDDFADGLLFQEELRDKFDEVYDKSLSADEYELLAPPAKALVAASVIGGEGVIVDAIDVMDAACESLGL